MRGAFHITGIFILAAVLCTSTAWGEERNSSVADYNDCTKVEVNLDGGIKELTADERSALMDEALYESLARFDRCRASSISESGSSGSDSLSSTSEGQTEGSEGDGESTNAVESFVSSSISGAEAGDDGGDASDKATESVQSVASPSASGTEVGDEDGAGGDAVALKSPSLKADKKPSLNNGKIPEDIPPSDNDSVLQAQMRAAAMAEQDPKRRAALWNEYRKYKGLPQVEEESE